MNLNNKYFIIRSEINTSSNRQETFEKNYLYSCITKAYVPFVLSSSKKINFAEDLVTIDVKNIPDLDATDMYIVKSIYDLYMATDSHLYGCVIFINNIIIIYDEFSYYTCHILPDTVEQTERAALLPIIPFDKFIDEERKSVDIINKIYFDLFDKKVEAKKSYNRSTHEELSSLSQLFISYTVSLGTFLKKNNEEIERLEKLENIEENLLKIRELRNSNDFIVSTVDGGLKDDIIRIKQKLTSMIENVHKKMLSN